VTIHVDAKAAIALVAHTLAGTEPRIARPRVGEHELSGLQAIQGLRVTHLLGEAASEKERGRTSIAWLKPRIPQHYTTVTVTEGEKGKNSIIPPAPPEYPSETVQRIVPLGN
jgi:hypothetical protein